MYFTNFIAYFKQYSMKTKSKPRKLQAQSSWRASTSFSDYIAK